MPTVARGLLGKTRYSNIPTLNSSRTKGIYIKLSGGFDALGFFDFNSSAMTLAASGETINLDFNDCRWHTTNPNYVIGHIIEGKSIIIRDITGATSDSTYTMSGVFPANAYISQFSASSDNTTFAFTVVQDAPSYAVLGYGYIKTNGTQAYYVFANLDEVEISRDGTYIVVKDLSRKVYVRNIVGGTIYTLNPGAEEFPGHSNVGTSYIFGYSDMTGPGGHILRWALTNGVAGGFLFTPPDYSQGMHTSISATTDDEAIISTYKANGSAAVVATYDNAIFKVNSSGVITFLGYHGSAFNDGYWGAPRADWSGDWVCYTSNFNVVGAHEVCIISSTPDIGSGSSSSYPYVRMNIELLIPQPGGRPPRRHRGTFSGALRAD